MNLLKKAVCLTLTGCMIISSCCISFAETDTPRRDKDAIEVSQEELELMGSLKSERKNHTKIEADGTEKGNRLEEKETRAKIFEEAESNDTFAKADLLYYGERFKGWIDHVDDVDIFEIKFKESGTVQFQLWGIPRGCDYDMTVYDQNYDEIDWSNNQGDVDEKVIIEVEAGVSYYALIECYGEYDPDDYYYVDVEYCNPVYCLSVGVDYDRKNVDTSDDAELFAEDMESIGFITKVLDTAKYGRWFNTFLRNGGPELLEADVIMLAGHGSQNGMFFNYMQKGGDYATGIKNGDSREMVFEDRENDVPKETYQMIGLDNYDVSDTVLAVLCGCNTAYGGRSSFAETTSKNHGVNCVIGWADSIKDVDAELWLDRFGRRLARGESIRMAAYYANTKNDYLFKDQIVGALIIYNEKDNSFDLSLEEYAEQKSGEVWRLDNESVSKRVSNLLKKKISTEDLQKMDEDSIDCEVIQVTEPIEYSIDDKDLNEISAYISENIDENFDIDRYEVLTDICNVICDDEIFETSIALNLKKGDFVTTDGYYVVVKDGFVDMIFINGDPMESQKDMAQPFSTVNEDMLMEKALEEIELANNEVIETQRVYKKYDTEPYYVVMTKVHNTTNDFYRVESYEYR